MCDIVTERRLKSRAKRNLGWSYVTELDPRAEYFSPIRPSMWVNLEVALNKHKKQL